MDVFYGCCFCILYGGVSRLQKFVGQCESLECSAGNFASTSRSGYDLSYLLLMLPALISSSENQVMLTVCAFWDKPS